MRNCVFSIESEYVALQRTFNDQFNFSGADEFTPVLVGFVLLDL